VNAINVTITKPNAHLHTTKAANGFFFSLENCSLSRKTERKQRPRRPTVAPWQPMAAGDRPATYQPTLFAHLSPLVRHVRQSRSDKHTYPACSDSLADFDLPAIRGV